MSRGGNKRKCFRLTLRGFPHPDDLKPRKKSKKKTSKLEKDKPAGRASSSSRLASIKKMSQLLHSLVLSS